MGRKIRHIVVSVLLLHSLILWKYIDLGTFQMVRLWTERPDVRRWTEGIFWIWDISEHEDMHPSDLWRQPSSWSLLTVLLTWLSPSWNVVCLYTDLVKKDLLLGITFRSFLALGIAKNKDWEFPDSIPFPLPVSWEVVRSLLAITGRKIDLIRTTDWGGADVNVILNPFRAIVRTHLLSVNSSYCSTEWANLPPTGMSGHGKDWQWKGLDFRILWRMRLA